MKTIENPIANVANEVVNQSIVTLNEFKNVKLSSISSKKRPEAKENRAIATSVLDNWDNVEVLEKIFCDKEVTNETIKGIVFDRMTALRAAQGIAKLEAEKAKKETFAAKETKKVGDLHKNGKWVWTEYAPGKFDWRTRPELKQRPGAKAKAGEESTKKGKPAKKAASKASTVKTPVKNTETKTSAEPNQKPLTIDEWIALPNKRSIVAKKISDAQKEAFKLIMKGYRLTSDMKFFENGESRKSCNIESVQALFARYGINYLPEGLVK